MDLSRRRGPSWAWRSGWTDGQGGETNREQRSREPAPERQTKPTTRKTTTMTESGRSLATCGIGAEMRL